MGHPDLAALGSNRGRKFARRASRSRARHAPAMGLPLGEAASVVRRAGARWIWLGRLLPFLNSTRSSARVASGHSKAMLSRTLVIPPFLDASRPGTQPRAAAPARPCDIWEDMLDHLYLVHPMGCDGSIVIASKLDGAYTEKLLRIRDITKRDLVGQQFLSMNRFGRRRLASMLTACGHVWVDLDPYGEDAQGNPLPYRGMDLEALMALLLAAIAAAGLPAPSYVTDSGRGLHLVWLCEALPGRAGEKMSRIQEAFYGPVLTDDGSVPARRLEDPDRDAQEARLAPLWRLFKDAGLDRQTLDRARVLRLWGSYNPSAGRYCRRLWPAEVEDVRRCTVDAIADAVLPLTGTAYRKRMAEKAARAAIEAPADPKPRRARASNPYAGRWGYGSARPPTSCGCASTAGHRGRAAAPVAVLGCQRPRPVQRRLPKVWADLLAPLAGLSRKEALDCLGTLGRRMKRHEAGETREHKRQLWSPLYNYSGAKMASALGVTAEEADAAGSRSSAPTRARRSHRSSARRRSGSATVPSPTGPRRHQAPGRPPGPRAAGRGGEQDASGRRGPGRHRSRSDMGQGGDGTGRVHPSRGRCRDRRRRARSDPG